MDITYVIVRMTKYDEKNFTKPNTLFHVFADFCDLYQGAGKMRINGSVDEYPKK